MYSDAAVGYSIFIEIIVLQLYIGCSLGLPLASLLRGLQCGLQQQTLFLKTLLSCALVRPISKSHRIRTVHHLHVHITVPQMFLKWRYRGPTLHAGDWWRATTNECSSWAQAATTSASPLTSGSQSSPLVLCARLYEDPYVSTLGWSS